MLIDSKRKEEQTQVETVLSGDHAGTGRSGFTLIEIMVAMLVIAVGVLGATAMQTTALKATILTRNVDTCTHLSFAALDRIHASASDIAGYTGGDYGTDFVVSPTAGCPSGTSDAAMLCESMENMQFDFGALSVSFDSDFPVTGVDTVSVSVTWDHNGEQYECQAIDIIPTG